MGIDRAPRTPGIGRSLAQVAGRTSGLERRFLSTGAAIDLILVDVADPGAGNPADMYTVEAGKVILLRGLSFLFTTDATAITRYPAIDARDGSDNVFTTYLLTDDGQEASDAIKHSFPGNDGVNELLVTIDSDTFTQRAVPDSLMKEDWTLRLFAGDMQAGDEFTNIRLLLQRFDAA